MKKKNIKLFATTIVATTLITGISANAATVFSANFDSTTVADFGGTIGYGAQLTKTNLDAGTATGSWTVNQAQDAPATNTAKMIQTDNGVNVTDKALRFGISTDGTMEVDTAVLTANLTSTLSLSNTITVSFDYGIISGDAANRTTYMTGLDGSGNRLFQIGFINTNANRQMGYFNTTGNWTLIGTSGDLIGNNNTFWDAALMKNVTVEVGASTYDIKLAGVTLTGGSGITFRDASASGLSNLALSANNRFTGGAFDNMVVSQQVPEPSTTALLGLGGLALILRRRK
ncbi:MAG: hypothetical protein ACI9E1_001232 [Cryomorphaceae bacterium]|jgi:hypothetical protein